MYDKMCTLHTGSDLWFFSKAFCGLQMKIAMASVQHYKWKVQESNMAHREATTTQMHMGSPHSRKSIFAFSNKQSWK